MVRRLTIAATLLLALALAAPPASHAARPSAGRDTRAPALRVLTPNGAIRLGAPAANEWTTITGRAYDAGKGISSFEMMVCPGSVSERGWTCGPTAGVVWSPYHDAPDELREGRPVMSCTSRSRRLCSFSARMPSVPGSYVVVVSVVDRARNRTIADAIQVTVV